VDLALAHQNGFHVVRPEPITMSDTTPTTVAVACQGGGSHTAFTAGVLRETLRSLPEEYEIGSLSGTSGGAMCAALAWDGLRRDDVAGDIDRLGAFWEDVAAAAPWERLLNDVALWGSRFAGSSARSA
jgi:NTE family protein